MLVRGGNEDKPDNSWGTWKRSAVGEKQFQKLVEVAARREERRACEARRQQLRTLSREVVL